MGQWEEFCTICGGPLWINNKYEQTWLNDIVGVQSDEVTVRLGDYNGYGAFVMADGNLFDSKTNIMMDNATGCVHGIVCHRQCVRLIRSMGYPVTYNALWNKVGASGQLKGCYKRFLPMSKYQKQDFDLQALHKHNDEWLLESPAHANQNRERIVKIWDGLKNKPPAIWAKMRPLHI